MNNGLTTLEVNRAVRVGLASLLVWSAASIPMELNAEEKKVFTHTADLRSGREDALLDIFKSISDQFESDYGALGAAYTTGEILYQQKRYDDAIHNYETVASKGKKYTFLAECARLRVAQTHLLNGEPANALVIGREAAGSNNKFIAAEAWYTLARAHLAMGKIDRAEDAYRNVITVNPVYATILKVDLLAGLLAYERGAYLEAATHFQRHSDNIPSLYYSIACFCQMKDIAKAVSSYQSLLAKAKKGTWVDRARILIGEAIYQTRD